MNQVVNLNDWKDDIHSWVAGTLSQQKVMFTWVVQELGPGLIRRSCYAVVFALSKRCKLNHVYREFTFYWNGHHGLFF